VGELIHCIPSCNNVPTSFWALCFIKQGAKIEASYKDHRLEQGPASRILNEKVITIPHTGNEKVASIPHWQRKSDIYPTISLKQGSKQANSF
jgi:hypothetical protein